MSTLVGPRLKRLIVLGCLQQDEQWRTSTLAPGSTLHCDADFFGTRIRATVDQDELQWRQGEFVMLGLADKFVFDEWVARELCRVDAVDLPQPAPFSV